MILNNGMQIHFSTMREAQTMGITLMVGSGSRDEMPSTSGVCHFLEHMCFKGSGKYRNPTAVSEALDRLGAEFNAYTEKEITYYYVAVDKRHWLKALDIMVEMTANPRFVSSEFELERQVILDEISSDDDDPDWLLANLISEMTYGAHPLSMPIGGYPATVRKLQLADMKRFRDAHYVGPNMTLSLAGDISRDDWYALKLSSHLAPLKRFPNRHVPIRRAFHFWSLQPHVKAVHKPFSQSHFELMFLTEPETHDAYYANILLAAILGGCQSSRLFREVRDGSGLTYDVVAEVSGGQDASELRISGSSAPGCMAAVIKLTVAEVLKLTKKPVDRDELDKAKAVVIGNTLRHHESAAELSCARAAWHFSRSRRQDLGTEVMFLETVKAEDVLRAAQTTFRGNRVNLAVVGPKTDGFNWRRLLDPLPIQI